MDICYWQADRKECDRLAVELFMQTSGINKEGPKFKRMQDEAFRIRTVVDDRVKIRAAYICCGDVKLSGRQADIGGTVFQCNAFELIEPDTVTGAYVYALSAGNFEFPDEPIMNQLYADIWGTAFTDAVRIMMKKEIEQKTRLSDSFGPGFYGMDITEMKKLASLINFEKLNLELRKTGIILPQKSCAGLLFSVNEHYKALNASCLACMGARTSCRLCHLSEGAGRNV